MEQRAVVRFFTLKGAKAQDILAELQLLSGLEVPDLPTAKKSLTCFQQNIRF
jgi:hypothetical protein